MKQLNFSGFCSEEFPQRKALDRGIENLTTVELISLIIGAGTEKSVEQARQIYAVIELTDEGLELAEQGIEDDTFGYDLCYGRAKGLAGQYSQYDMWKRLTSYYVKQ